ncbi:hypothetical protein GCM10027262_11420 [Nocardia tengchongensis]
MQFTMLKSVSTYLGVASCLLNRQLELLEQQVGGPLFIRYLSPTPQRPTARGQALLDALEAATVQNQMVAALGGRDCLRLPGTDTAVQRRPYDGLSVRAITPVSAVVDAAQGEPANPRLAATVRVHIRSSTLGVCTVRGSNQQLALRLQSPGR